MKMSSKDFRRGTEAAAKAHYIFMRKQGAATKELEKRIIKKIDELGNIVDVIIDTLTQQDMERIFGICTSLDIGTLEPSEQKILLSYLKTLTIKYGQNTQLQSDYFFAVKRYLNIANVSEMDLATVSDMDISRSELRTFLECVCEFLFLQKGTREFLDEFKNEIECFGLNDKIIDEIVSTIEKTYFYFGVQGIIEHYNIQSVEPAEPKKTEEDPQPLKIPYFEKPIIIIYSSRSKQEAVNAKILEVCIKDKLENFGLKCDVEIYPENKAKKKMAEFEKDDINIIYAGEPSMSKTLREAVPKWDYDEFGMKYLSRGNESIVKVNKLEKNKYGKFLEFVKKSIPQQEQSVSETFRKQEDTILSQAFSKDESLAFNIMVGILGSWLILPSALIDLSGKADAKTNLKRIQYNIVADKFISSKIDPYLTDRK